MLLTLLVLITACIALSLSMQRHFKQLLPKTNYTREISWLLKGLGYILLALALALAFAKAILTNGIGIGTIHFKKQIVDAPI